MTSRKASKKVQSEAIAAVVVLAVLYFLISTSAGHEVAGALVVAVVVIGGLFVFRKASKLRKDIAKTRALNVSDIDSMSSWAFEQYVAKLFHSRGFETVVTKGSGDSGVDVVASKSGTSYAV